MASDKDRTDNNRTAAAVGLGIATAAAAAGAFLLTRSSSRRPDIETDAPYWTLNENSSGEGSLTGKTLLVKAPREALFQAWQKVEDFPRFMENVERVERDGDLTRWTINAPAGSEVTLVNRITEQRGGEYIRWQSEPESDIVNSGEVHLKDAPAGRGTYVTLVLNYDPPGGPIGKLFAKLFQREPAIQARRDLRRFKQLIETGEVTTNASPSGRSSESPAEARI